MNDRKRFTGLTLTALVSASLLLSSRSATASSLDVGAAAGVVKRSLSDTDYKTGFTWQLSADLAMLPILTIGPYLTFAKGTPDVSGSPTDISFRTIGLRSKLKLPVPGAFTPYGVAGVGWVHGDFPNQVLSKCDPSGLSCLQTTVPSATANFAEFVLGAGFMLQLAKQLAFTAEFNWRPSTGYKNDIYEQQIQAQSTGAPDPSRNGAAWVGLFGLALTL